MFYTRLTKKARVALESVCPSSRKSTDNFAYILWAYVDEVDGENFKTREIANFARDTMTESLITLPQRYKMTPDNYDIFFAFSGIYSRGIKVTTK